MSDRKGTNTAEICQTSLALHQIPETLFALLFFFFADPQESRELFRGMVGSVIVTFLSHLKDRLVISIFFTSSRVLLFPTKLRNARFCIK